MRSISKITQTFALLLCNLLCMALTIGGKAPNFTLKDQNGKNFELYKHIQNGKPIVIFFYPKDNSLGCTREACSFRDSYQDFVDAGALVIGINGGSEQSHKDFISHNKLPFTILVDEGNQVRKLFGVKNSLGIIPGRVTFVLDKNGIVKSVFDSQINMSGHAKTALEMIKSLK
jgi:peroxiredoxin Q/BCP